MIGRFNFKRGPHHLKKKQIGGNIDLFRSKIFILISRFPINKICEPNLFIYTFKIILRNIQNIFKIFDCVNLYFFLFLFLFTLFSFFNLFFLDNFLNLSFLSRLSYVLKNFFKNLQITFRFYLSLNIQTIIFFFNFIHFIFDIVFNYDQFWLDIYRFIKYLVVRNNFKIFFFY